MTPKAATRTLSTAEERREALVEAAIPIFAQHGFRAASTIEIAGAAGISQAYLFRLFPTKVDLFLAVCEATRERMFTAFRDAARNRDDDTPAMRAMGDAYGELLASDRDLLMCQLQSQVVSGEPAIAASMQETFRRLFALVEELTEATDDEMRGFFAQGMLMNVLAVIDAHGLDETWARVLSAKPTASDC